LTPDNSPFEDVHVIGGGERSGLALMFAVLLDASAGWRGVKITPTISRELDALMTDSNAKPGVRLAA
jgi:hypothetical protein